MPAPTSYTFPLTAEQQARLAELLSRGTYRPIQVPHTQIAVQANDCKVMLYRSGKCLVQGKGASEWVQFVLEPMVLGEIRIGYDEVLHPELFERHMGIDESGKGDYFGAMVISAVYADPDLVRSFQSMGVKDSKNITSDRKARDLARDLQKLLGNRFAVVRIGPRAYNRLYAKMRSVNSVLAWGHARAIENLLEAVPDCPRAVADQFGPRRQVEAALMKKGRRIQLDQRPKAESDPAVAAASILARAGYLDSLQKLSDQYGVELPKGASSRVIDVGRQLVEANEPAVLLETAKCHFKTTDKVLAAVGRNRTDLGPDGAAVSKAASGEPSA